MAAIPVSILTFGAETVARAQRNLGATRTINRKKRRAVASGLLKESLTYKVLNTPEGYKVKFFAKGKASKYAMYVEYGRRPNKKRPPTEAIEKWIKQKPVRIRREGRIVKQTPELIAQTAYVMAKKIGEEGIPALNYFRDAIRDTREEMQAGISKKLVNKLIAQRFGKRVR